MNGEECTRKRIEIEGDNYYIVVGDTFVDLTIPHENRPFNIPQRILLNEICKAISLTMEERRDRHDNQSDATER